MSERDGAMEVAVDVDRLADILHDDIEAEGYICHHANQHLSGKDCGRKALSIIARLQDAP